VRQTEERLVGKGKGQFVSTARGAARWNEADKLAGEAWRQTDMEMDRDWYLIKFNLALTVANFEPLRKTLYICGRPVQARALLESN
jgi:hypothetical protein